MQVEHLTTCTKCGRTCQPSTYERTGGLCIPCDKERSRKALEAKVQFSTDCLFSVPYLLLAGKSDDYREAILLTAEATALVLTEAKIAEENLIERFRTDPESFHLYAHDLRTEVSDFGATGYQRWLQNVDRWKARGDLPKYVSTLTKQLQKWTKENH